MSTVLNEEALAQAWLRDYLDADATLGAMVSGIWLHSVPMTAPLPVVKIDRQDSTDLYTVNLYRVWDDLLYLIRDCYHWTGQGQQDWTDVTAIAARLDVLLHKHSEVTTNGLQVDVFREQSFIDEQANAGGGEILYAGGMYRIRAHAT